MKKLIYRGHIYYYDPSKTSACPVRPSPYQLHYRGATYQVSQTVSRDAVRAKEHSNKVTIC